MNQEDEEMRPTVLKRENLVLREKVAAFGDIMKDLEGMPHTVVQDILQRLRTGSDPIDVLQSLRSYNLGVTPSAQDMARGMLPTIHSNCEFELLISHPGAFPLIDLSPYAQASGSTLVKPVHLSTPEFAPSDSTFKSVLHGQPSNCQTDGNLFLEDLDSSESSKITVDTTAPQYFDPRLAHLKIDFWTAVPISDTQAAAAISLYFEAQHHVWGVFDAGLFLCDLIEFRFDYCSPFMVSSLLAIACLCYAPLDPQASKFSYACEKEAEKLFQSEGKVDSLPTIAGLALLYVSLAVHGEGVRALKFLKAASEAAEQLKMFGVPDALETLGSDSQETLVATSATAWGLFNLMVHGVVRFYQKPPISYPPKLPMSAELNMDHSLAYKTRCESMAPREKLAALNTGLATFSKLYMVVNQVYLIYRDQGSSGVSLAFALSKYSKLLRLADDLPPTMVRSMRTANHALIFHMTVHLAIIDIFRPFVAPEKQHGFRTYVPQGASPISIFAASVKQLKSLIFEYTYQHPATHYNQFFPAPIVYAANAVLNDKLDPQQRFYFFYYVRLGQKFKSTGGGRAVNGTMQALLALAYDRGAITSAEAVQFMEQFRDDEYVKEAEVVRMESGWAIDMDLAIEDTAAAKVDLLVNRLEEITLFNKFTEGLV
ncbi:Nn.00g076960.m01.CDS01 [Neocucurbitaria sp. VM-36]